MGATRLWVPVARCAFVAPGILGPGFSGLTRKRTVSREILFSAVAGRSGSRGYDLAPPNERLGTRAKHDTELN